VGVAVGIHSKPLNRGAALPYDYLDGGTDLSME
jgi:hypothetical protein